MQTDEPAVHGRAGITGPVAAQREEEHRDAGSDGDGHQDRSGRVRPVDDDRVHQPRVIEDSASQGDRDDTQEGAHASGGQRTVDDAAADDLVPVIQDCGLPGCDEGCGGELEHGGRAVR